MMQGQKKIKEKRKNEKKTSHGPSGPSSVSPSAGPFTS
jgi:hypothetical protein